MLRNIWVMTEGATAGMGAAGFRIDSGGQSIAFSSGTSFFSHSERTGTEAGGVHVLWSGSFAELEDPPGGLFDEDPRTWGPKGWGALERALGAGADAGQSVCVRPHARHVVSDVPGCIKVLTGWAARGVQLLADPASMLTPAMLDNGTALDVLVRAYEALATPVFAKGVLGVLVANVEGDPVVGVRAVPLTGGRLDSREISRLALWHSPTDVPLILIGPNIHEQLAILAGAPKP